MAIQQFDELNGRKEFIQKYYSIMNVSQKAKDRRVDVALDYAEIMIMLFLLITEQQYEREECISFLTERLKVIAERETDTEDLAYIKEWAETTAEEIVDQTYEKYENELEDISIEEEKTDSSEEKEKETEKKEPVYNFKEYDVEIPQKDFPTSNFRATLLGIQCATTVVNYDELLDSIAKGYTRKVWVTEEDDRVRDTHAAVAGVDIPINELFIVGNSLMLMPGDTLNGAEMKEILNCRCHLTCY